VQELSIIDGVGSMGLADVYSIGTFCREKLATVVKTRGLKAFKA